MGGRGWENPRKRGWEISENRLPPFWLQTIHCVEFTLDHIGEKLSKWHAMMA
jgi:hypothetical protein